MQAPLTLRGLKEELSTKLRKKATSDLRISG